MPSLILMGIKHCGKSTQGRLLGQELALPFYDTDAIILEQEGRGARQIYIEGGEGAFKEAEARACAWLRDRLAADRTDAVVATGGGICGNRAALDVLRPLGTFVFLVADERMAADRIVREARAGEDGSLGNLPAYIAKKNPRSIREVRKYFHEFYEERTRLYARLADIQVPMSNAPKSVNTARILESLKPER